MLGTWSIWACLVSRPRVTMEEVKSCPSMVDCTPQPSRAPHDIDSPTNVCSSALAVSETQETDGTHQVPPLPGMERVEAGG